MLSEDIINVDAYQYFYLQHIAKFFSEFEITR